MTEATDYTNCIAAKENDDLARGDQEVRQDHDPRSQCRAAQGVGRRRWWPRPTSGPKAASAKRCSIFWQEGRRLSRPPPSNLISRYRPGNSTSRPYASGDPACSCVLLDRLEEWIIATLIAAATTLIFVAVLHRYCTGISIDLSKLAAAQGLYRHCRCVAGRVHLADRLGRLVGAGGLHLHVHLDGQVRRRLRRAHRHPCRRRRARQHARTDVSAPRHPVRTAVRRHLHRHRRQPSALLSSRTSTRPASSSNDLEAPMWIVYLAVPLGSYLMCFRFLQVAWHFCQDRRTAASR